MQLQKLAATQEALQQQLESEVAAGKRQADLHTQELQQAREQLQGSHTRLAEAQAAVAAVAGELQVRGLQHCVGCLGCIPCPQLWQSLS
jgi:hypothetical protein